MLPELVLESSLKIDGFNVKTIRNYRNEEELKWLVGPGVSAAAILYLRRILDKRGWKKVGIVASINFISWFCSFTHINNDFFEYYLSLKSCQLLILKFFKI